jgi:hypothetical protein
MFETTVRDSLNMYLMPGNLATRNIAALRAAFK